MSSQQRHHSTPGGFLLPDSNQLDTRTWKDSRGTEWYICDSCDAAVDKDGLFVATVMDYRIDEAGAFYCRACAEDLISEWSARMVPFEDDE